MSSFSLSKLYVHSENIAVSVIMAVVGVFGLVSNGTAILAVRYNPRLRNSFGLLCFLHCIANIGILVVFVFWTAPVTLFGNEIAMKLIGKVFGLVDIMLWNVSVYSQMAIALNRVIAIAMPLQASFVLTVRNTTFVVVICWILGSLHTIPYFWTERCFIFFDTVKWTWTFAETACGHIISAVDFYSVLTVLILIFLFDCTTLICLRIKQLSMKTHIIGGRQANAVQRKKHKVEILFFKQALCANALLIYQHVSFHCIRPLFVNRWAVFFTGAFPWELSNALDGFVIVLLHFRFSHLGKKTSPTTLTAVVPSVKTFLK